MAVFQCKCCFAPLKFEEGATIAECEYCRVKQTLPTTKDENLKNLFTRANALRSKAEFDKAEQVYERILQADTKQAEAYWGLILCKYGIEYVEDKTTNRRVPTCHRASFQSIVADDDFKCALEYADSQQKSIYEAEAVEIDKIQKDILAIAQKESPYDVFICYKESDENGTRTKDSVIANEIYYQLTQEGFKVFYAAITLEDKLGSAYEPIIFSALNSAKVMLAIGTKPEYLNAVWVKNEWSRYLKMIQKDRSKMLIPCYRDMDPYDLPEEFAHLQAQDMGKIGFINDIVRGIKKVMQTTTETPVVMQKAVVQENPQIAPLLKRAYLFLEDRDFDNANAYAERILDIDPELAEAYFVKLLCDLGLTNKEGLTKESLSYVNNPHYQKAVRFADEEFKKELQDIAKEHKYQRARKYEKQKYYERAYQLFISLGAYKDSVQHAEECQKMDLGDEGVMGEGLNPRFHVGEKKSVQDLESERKKNNRMIALAISLPLITLICMIYFIIRGI